MTCKGIPLFASKNVELKSAQADKRYKIEKQNELHNGNILLKHNLIRMQFHRKGKKHKNGCRFFTSEGWEAGKWIR